MNNYQNLSFGKSFFRTNNLTEFKETYGSDQKNAIREENTSRGTKPNTKNSNKPFKIFIDSNEPLLTWNVKSVNKQISKELKTHGKKVKKNSKKVLTSKKSVEVKTCVPAAEPQLTEAFVSGTLTKTIVNSYLSRTGDLVTIQSEPAGVRDVAQKSEPKLVPETRRTYLNALYMFQKGSQDFDRKWDKMDSLFRPLQSTMPKEEMEPEVKPTISDFGKKHINEILKNHAQKIKSSSSKSLHTKDSTYHGVSDLLKKMQNTSGSEVGGKDEKKSKPKTVKPGESKSVDLQDTTIGGDTNEEKKKQSSSWMKIPQSNELERRLKGTWEGTGFMFPKSTEGVEEENSNQEIAEETEAEEQKQTDKRKSYTNRFFLLKSLDKDLHSKTLTTMKGGTEGSKETGNHPKTTDKSSQPSEKTYHEKELEVSLRKRDMPACYRAQVAPPLLNIKEISVPKDLQSCKELLTLKDVRARNTEHLIKTKATRSAELKDLVNQAIKDHKIFCIFDNHSYIVRPVREELLNRGWLEVIPDRRLIPRRRPPPMGPVFERDKLAIERNCNTLEAILTARENFADELHSTVSKSQSFKTSLEKSKALPVVPVMMLKKNSDDSLNETPSQFRIIPPTPERKKNNLEIREFVIKCESLFQRETDKDKELKKYREKEKAVTNTKKNRQKTPIQVVERVELRTTKKEEAVAPTKNTGEGILLPGSKSYMEVLQKITENNETLKHVATEIGKIDPRLLQKIDLEPVSSSTEKTPASKDSNPMSMSSSKSVLSESEAKTVSKIIQSSNARIHFMWLSIKPSIHLKCFNYSPEIINKFQRTTFCTKIGLWSHLSNIQWYAHEVHYPAKSPRMYNTGESDDLQAFFEDFQLTACIGLLKWLCETFFDRGLKAVQAKKGKVPLKAFEFAIKQCERYIRFKENEDLCPLEETKVHQDEWNTFLQWFYIITNDHGRVQETSSAQVMVMYTKALETLKLMKRHWPEIDIDGRLNIWIMKPYCASCGRGIFMTNNVYYIGQHSKYIVQKYIEKPLLIYNTKFDIRQWFMITKLTPLEIWMYKECYLRFCTQPFALRNLHESVHLSNNSVQRKYIGFRDPSLPDQNMWDSNTFQLYLKTIGQPNVWEDVIYPGMRDAIVSTMLASQDTFDGPRKSWFEVYGADFMLSANVREGPWLIEINENPAMDPSTKVTARLCPQMLRDVIKVVVDKKCNKTASTGQWELIYRQNYSPSFGTVDLDVRGKKIARVSQKATQNYTHPSTSPGKARGISPDPDRMYEFVKSYEKRQKIEGDGKEDARGTTKVVKNTDRPSKTVTPPYFPGEITRNKNSSWAKKTQRLAGNEAAPRSILTSEPPVQTIQDKKEQQQQQQSAPRGEKYKIAKFYKG